MRQSLGKILSIQEIVQFNYINISLFININIFLSIENEYIKLGCFHLVDLGCYNVGPTFQRQR